jgi:hypothetical protein
MNIGIYGTKHGVGVSVITAALAVTARHQGFDVAIVDWHGDLDAILGTHNLLDDEVRWLDQGLQLVSGIAYDNMPELIHSSDTLVFHDCGIEIEPALATYLDATILVTTPCYVALRRAVARDAKADYLVYNGEPMRALTSRDVERALGIPMSCELTRDPGLARTVDAGLMMSRIPESTRLPLIDLVRTVTTAWVEVQHDSVD